jgi:type IV pilus assembly protein PilP
MNPLVNNQQQKPWRRVAMSLAMLMAWTLGACGSSDESEVRRWMQDQRASMKSTVQKVDEPRDFAPFTYSAQGMADPFDPQKILMAVARQRLERASPSAIKPDLDRRREILEGYPLDQIRMVGMMRRAGANVALVEVNGGTHAVHAGNYIGQNFGLVTRISETEVQLKEIYQDAGGDWVERPQRLELQLGQPASGQGSKK